MESRRFIGFRPETAPGIARFRAPVEGASIEPWRGREILLLFAIIALSSRVTTDQCQRVDWWTHDLSGHLRVKFYCEFFEFFFEIDRSMHLERAIQHR